MASTRVYLLCAPDSRAIRSASSSGLPAVELLRHVPIRAVTGPPELRTVVEDLATLLDLPAGPLLDGLGAGSAEAWMDALASGYADSETCAVVPPWAVAEILGRVLGTEAPRFGALASRSLCALEWPVGPQPGGRLPTLAGLDLDWLPPRTLGGRERFPSGPS